MRKTRISRPIRDTSDAAAASAGLLCRASSRHAARSHSRVPEERPDVDTAHCCTHTARAGYADCTCTPIRQERDWARRYDQPSAARCRPPRSLRPLHGVWAKGRRQQGQPCTRTASTRVRNARVELGGRVESMGVIF